MDGKPTIFHDERSKTRWQSKKELLSSLSMPLTWLFCGSELVDYLCGDTPKYGGHHPKLKTK